MFYIKLDENMNLVITVNEPIYRGDNLKQKITYLIPKTVGEIDMLTATVYLSFIRADGTADIALLVREENEYNRRFYQYHLPITCTLSRYPGEVCTFLQIFAGSAQSPIIAKSGECVLHIRESTNMDEYITDRNLRLIYEMQQYMENRVNATEAVLTARLDETDAAIAAKADNIVFDAENSTIQLVSTTVVKDDEGNEIGTEQTPLGDPIFVLTDITIGIANIEINADGELVVTFDNGTIQNLGRVVGEDGAVYMPHIDEHRVLTFTVEPEPDGVPEPVDLNPNDEWSEIADESGTGVVTDYVWEGIE